MPVPPLPRTQAPARAPAAVPSAAPSRAAATPRAKESLPPPSMSDAEKQALALQALGLLNEQIQARIVHYKAELATSPELDAVTAQVVNQLKAMQAAASRTPHAPAPVSAIEAQQAHTLGTLLARIFNPENSNFVTQILKPVGRRIAKLFFESELHEKTKGDKDKKIYHAEQGVYYVLHRYRNRLLAELEGFDYLNDDIRQLTKDLLTKVERDLQIAFLSRRSPELNRVMTIYTAVLSDFLQHHLPPLVADMARRTIEQARTARRPDSIGYKVRADAFPEFRAEWERLLIQQMVFFCGDELLARLQEQNRDEVREETIKFFTDPHVFSETCEVLCESLYDMLCMEGFLDLPLDWRASLGRST